MKQAVLSILLIFAVSFALADDKKTTTTTKTTGADKSASSSATDDAIKKMERELWDAWKAKDMGPFEKLVASDAVGNDMMQGWQTKDAMIKGMKDMPCDVNSYSISDEKMTHIDKDATLYTYTANVDATCGGQKVPDKVYASSVWAKRGAKWETVFHQETPAMPAPPKS